MLVKFCKKAVLVLVVIMLPALTEGSALVSGRAEAATINIPRSSLEVTFEGIRHYRQSSYTSFVEARYSVRTGRYERVYVETAESMLKDANDVEISMAFFNQTVSGTARQGARERLESLEVGVHINEKYQDAEELGPHQPNIIMIRYLVDNKYVLTPTFKAARVVINGFTVEFEDVPVYP